MWRHYRSICDRGHPFQAEVHGWSSEEREKDTVFSDPESRNQPSMVVVVGGDVGQAVQTVDDAALPAGVPWVVRDDNVKGCFRRSGSLDVALRRMWLASADKVAGAACAVPGFETILPVYHQPRLIDDAPGVSIVDFRVHVMHSHCFDVEHAHDGYDWVLWLGKMPSAAEVRMVETLEVEVVGPVQQMTCVSSANCCNQRTLRDWKVAGA